MTTEKVSVVMENWNIPLTPRVKIGYSGENAVTELEIITTPEEGFIYYLETEDIEENANNILLTPDYVDNRIFVLLTTEMLGKGGILQAQVVAYIDTEDEPVKKSNIFQLQVNPSINATKDVESHYQTALSQWAQILASFNPVEILNEIAEMEEQLDNKQNKLTAGYGITLKDPTDEISVDTEEIATKDYVISKQPTDTAKGTSLTLTDSDNAPIKEISIMGKSTQVQTKGYQLFNNLTNSKVVTNNGITFTVSNNGIYCNGTAGTGGSWFYIAGSDYLQTLASGTYTLSASGLLSGMQAYSGVKNFSNGTTAETRTQGTSSSAYLFVSAGTEVDTTVKLICESGSTAHDFEVYTGGQPSPSINYPQAITDITSEEIEITNGTDTQTANLDIVLRGIPVSSGGNYIDNNNQQWICDTIERYADGTGKLIRRVGVHTIDSNSSRNVFVLNDYTVHANTSIFSNPISNDFGVDQSVYTKFMNDTFEIKNIYNLDVEGTYLRMINADSRTAYYRISNSTLGVTGESTVQDVKTAYDTFMANRVFKYLIPLATPTETPLTAEQLEELDLDTYYPTTNINSNADVVVEYVCDTKNYIDKKTSVLQNAILSLGGNI